MKNPGTIAVFFALVMFASSCGQGSRDKDASAGGELKGKISISGAFALYPLAVQWAEEFQKVHPGVKIDISAGGAGKGMTDVLSGMVDFAMFSREVTIEEEEKGAWKIAVAKDAVFPTMNAGNPLKKEILAQGLTREQFISLYTTEGDKNWKSLLKGGTDEKLNVYTRSDACGAAAMWASYLGFEQENLLGTGVYGDPGIADAVKKDMYGIGYNNLNYVFDINTMNKYEGLEIIPLDLNGNRAIDPEENFYGSMQDVMKAIEEGKYPSPPARPLYLISKGKVESELLKAFLNYVLNDGQNLVIKSGYIKLKEDEIAAQKEKLGI